MPWHHWGSEWFEKHGEDLNDAMRYIHKEMKRRTGCIIFMKEKFGTIRYEYDFVWFWPGEWPIYHYFYPSRLWYGWPKWFRRVEEFASKTLNYIGYSEYKQKKQAKILKNIIYEAVYKWPHIKHEILEDISINEFVMGPDLQKEYWEDLTGGKDDKQDTSND